MTMFLAQSAIVLALAFVLGCMVGTLARQAMRRPAGESAMARLGQTAPAAALAGRPSAPSLEPPPADKPEMSRPKQRKDTSAKPALPNEPPPTDDDLKKIRGIGRQIEIRLHNLGIDSFAQIAAWTAKDRKEWGRKLAFPGRIEREDWVGQAKKLARGKETAFSRRVARGEVSSSRNKPERKKSGAR